MITERTKRWVRAAAAARYLGIARSSLYRLVEVGSIPTSVRHKIGRGLVLWDLDALDRVVESSGGEVR